MTEADWLACAEPEPMLEHLRGRASDRKLRLFAVACCRHLLKSVQVNPWDEHAVEVAERYADGRATAAELEQAADETTSDYTPAYACAEAAAPEGGVDTAGYAAGNAAHAVGEHLANEAGEYDPFPNDSPVFLAGRAAERGAQADLLRDIIGNPFRPVTLAPAVLTWDGRTVVRLAQAIYEERAYDRLPILADALEEAGCTDAELLAHCRQGDGHVRGCWALDLVLGKA
jgi:hypothetical protein